MAVRRRLAPADTYRCVPGSKREIHTALEVSEVQPRKTAATRRQRTVEAAADPQLVAGSAAERPDVRSDALFELSALLHDAIFVADESAAEKRRLEKSGSLQREKTGVGVFKPLRMRG